MTEHKALFAQKFFKNVSKVSSLKCFWKFVLVISLNLTLIDAIIKSYDAIIKSFVQTFQ